MSFRESETVTLNYECSDTIGYIVVLEFKV